MSSPRVVVTLGLVAVVALSACASGRSDRAPSPGSTSDAGASPDARGAPPPPDAGRGTDAHVGGAIDEGRCGDGVCSRATETCGTCAADCGACPARCGDGSCDPSETEASCALDCARLPSCGDRTCDASETCESCGADCGACPPRCGDGACDATETCSSCARDCGTCGGGSGDPCNVYSTCGSCVDQSGCGFCDGVCVSGSVVGPLDGRACGAWTWWSFAC